MKVTYKAANEMSPDAVRKSTGKSLQDWFSILDKFGGPAKGRRAIGEFLLRKNGVEAWWVTTLIVEYENARGVVEKDGKPKGYNICVTKAIKAKPSDVFDAFSDAGKLSKWFGPGTKLTFSEGGSFVNSDGNRGQFKKINPGKMIRFTWEGERHAGEVVEVKLQPSGAKCSVVLTHDRIQGRDSADGLRAAWGEAFERLKSQAEV